MEVDKFFNFSTFIDRRSQLLVSHCKPSSCQRYHHSHSSFVLVVRLQLHQQVHQHSFLRKEVEGLSHDPPNRDHSGLPFQSKVCWYHHQAYCFQHYQPSWKCLKIHLSHPYQKLLLASILKHLQGLQTYSSQPSSQQRSSF